MPQDMLTSLIGPLLFAIFGGVWAYVYRPERRQELMLTLIAMQLVSVYAYTQNRSTELFGLLVVLALTIFGLLLHLLLHAPRTQQSR